MSSDAVEPGCPALKGSTQRVVTNYSINEGEFPTADLRLAMIYDSVTPDPSTRYTLWSITFDHTHSIDGESPQDPSLCGGAEDYVGFNLTQAILLGTSGQATEFAGCDTPLPSGNIAAHWNGFYFCAGGPISRPSSDTCAPVPVRASTWGRVRATYH